MKIRHKLIPVAFAKPGMKLAAPVESNDGRVLLMTGSELSERLLSGLLKRNICCVTIEELDTRTEEVLAVERVNVTAHINAMFEQSPPGKNMQLLQLLILEYRLEPLL